MSLPVVLFMAAAVVMVALPLFHQLKEFTFFFSFELQMERLPYHLWSLASDSWPHSESHCVCEATWVNCVKRELSFSSIFSGMSISLFNAMSQITDSTVCHQSRPISSVRTWFTPIGSVLSTLRWPATSPSDCLLWKCINLNNLNVKQQTNFPKTVYSVIFNILIWISPFVCLFKFNPFLQLKHSVAAHLMGRPIVRLPLIL